MTAGLRAHPVGAAQLVRQLHGALREVEPRRLPLGQRHRHAPPPPGAAKPGRRRGAVLMSSKTLPSTGGIDVDKGWGKYEWRLTLDKNKIKLTKRGKYLCKYWILTKVKYILNKYLTKF